MKEIELFNDDCMKILPQIPSESVDLCVSDIPYLICGCGCTSGAYGNPSGIFDCDKKRAEKQLEYEYNPEVGSITKKGTKHVNLGGSVFNDAIENARSGKLFDYNSIKFSEYLPELYRVMKQKTHTYLMINARNLCELQTEAEKVGFKFQQLLVWHKNNATPNRYYLNQCEFILMLRKGGAKNINDMGQTNIIKIPNILGGKLHPTQKPTMLMQIMIANSSNEGDIVLDPFMGSGSTGIASKILNRKFIGIEIDKKYFDIAENRIKNEYKQMNLF